MADGNNGFISTTGATVSQEANETVKQVTHTVGQQISDAVSGATKGLITAGLVAGAATVDTVAAAHGLPQVATAAVAGSAIGGKKTAIG